MPYKLVDERPMLLKYVKLNAYCSFSRVNSSIQPGYGVFFAVHKFTEVPGDKNTLKDIPLNNVHANSRVTIISIT